MSRVDTSGGVRPRLLTIATGGTSVAIPRSMNSLKHVTRMAAHAAALIFGAFWLVATSAPAEPARDCFTGIANPTRLQVVLGPSAVQHGTASCAALDGLAPDGTLVFDLSQAPRSPDAGGGCWGYADAGAHGIDGRDRANRRTDDSTGPAIRSPRRAGRSSRPEQPACRGNYWSLRLAPGTAPRVGQVISPLDAGVGQPWIVERDMGIEQGQFCGSTFAEPMPAASAAATSSRSHRSPSWRRERRKEIGGLAVTATALVGLGGCHLGEDYVR